MERSVFLEMSPVVREQSVSPEQSEEFRRRAGRSLWRLAPYLELPLGLLVLVFVLRASGLASHGVSVFLTIAGIALLGIGILRVRDLIIESRILRSVTPATKALTFRNLDYWPLGSTFLMTGPPDQVDVLYPERVVIAADGKPLRTFKPIPLTLFEDLPWPDQEETARELTDFEVQEIHRRLYLYKRKAWTAFFFILLGIYTFANVLASFDRSQISDFVFVVLWPIALWFFWGDLLEAIRMKRILSRATETKSVAISWEGNLLRERLMPDELIWRDETGPVSWRRVTPR